MGFFDLFKKKPNTKDTPEELNLSVLYDLERRVLEMDLKTERHPEHLSVIVEEELELATAVLPNPNLHPLLSEILCIAIHPEFFPEGIEEVSVGMGDTRHAKAQYFAQNYMETVFGPIFESLSDGLQGELDFRSFPEGKEILWHVASGEMQVQGDWQESELPGYAFAMDLLSEEIKAKTPNRKINWLKIYAAKQADGSVTAECHLNNEPWPDASKKLELFANEWKVSTFKSAKQFFTFRRCDAFD